MRPFLASIPFVLLACATTEVPDGPSCAEGGKCDSGETVWKYEAGKTPWVTCTNAAGRVTCKLAPEPDGVRPTQVMFNKGDVTFYYPTPLSAASPQLLLPDNFTSSDQITALARAPMSGLGDIRKVLRAPAAGGSVSYSMPFDTWRVTVTSVGTAKSSLILRYPIEITDGQFMLTQSGKVDFFGGVSVTPGPAGESRSATYFLPTSPGGKVGAYFDAVAIGGPPQYYFDRPGCYLLEGAAPTHITFDEGCVRTKQLVPPTSPPTCACDVSSACDAGCTCDAACTTMPPGPTCVAGTSYECDDAGEHWTNSMCCLDGAVECVAGDQYACNGAGEHWTGSLCCVDTPAECVAGNQYDCTDSAERWTGSTCCLAKAVECVAGNQYDCTDSIEHWTGSVCCVDAPEQCVAGNQYACTDSGEHWTGSVCCVDAALSCVSGSESSCSGSGKHWTGSQCCSPP